MGKPLSRPDCLRQNPQCLGKGDEDEAYIEDCYVPQRSIYDTMRINEQIDQGTKLCQPSRSTLGSGGEVRGEGSTLNSNGTIGADLGSVFVSRNTDNASGIRKLDERVIFDALKLTGDLQMISPPLGIVGPGLPITPSSSGGVAAVAKRRLQGGDKRDNPNRRSWKAFMPPSFPEFAERLEVSAAEGAESRFSVSGVPSPSSLQPNPFHLQPNTPTSLSPSVLTYTTSSLSSAPTVSSSPSLTPTVSPVPPLQHPSTKQKQVHLELYKQHKQTSVVPSPTKEQLPTFVRAEAPKPSRNTPHQSPSIPRDVVMKQHQGHRRTISSSKAGIRHVLEETVESVKTSDSERDSPLLDLDQEDNAPLIPPKPVFCPPTKARTWPRSITTGKRTPVTLKHNFPLLPPLPPLLCEDSNMDEESLYLLDPPSPFLKEEGGLLHGGLPLSPCISQEGVNEEFFRWGAQGRDLRERTASELKFEEDERRILEEFEQQEQELCRKMMEEEEAVCQKLKKKAEEEERAQREEREWEAVLKLENREIKDNTWERETLESEKWGLMGSPCHWPLLTPPTGFGSPGVPSVSPCPSSESESDDLFLALERQCQEDEGEEGVEMSVDPENFEPHILPCLQEEEDETEGETKTEAFLLHKFSSAELDSGAIDLEKCVGEVKPLHSIHKEKISNFDVMRAKDCEKEHGVIDKECSVDDNEDKAELEEEEISYPTDSALGQQYDSDSSGAHVSKPDRIDLTDCEPGRHAQTETDPDSGASSESYAKDCEEKAAAPSQNTLNRYPEEIEEENEKDVQEHEEEDELETEWDVFEQSESSLYSCQGVLLNHSPDPLQMAEINSESGQHIDNQCSGQDDICISKPDMEVTSKGPDVALERVNVPLNDPGDPALETIAELTVGTPKSDSVTPVHLHQSASNLFSFPSSSISESCSTGLNPKNSEAVVISDSFVYLAVSAPPQCPSDCPPSPLEDLILPSLVSKPPHGPDTEEDRAILSPDSFVYMAAPERPQPSSSEVFSTCEDAPDLDLDSCSEGTQSGMDGAEFVLGSLTGDSDWESDGSIVDLSPLMTTDHHLEPGILQNLFAQTETGHALRCRPQEDVGPSGEKDLNLESGRSSNTENESSTILPSSSIEQEAKVCFHFNFYSVIYLIFVFQVCCSCCRGCISFSFFLTFCTCCMMTK